MDKLERKIIKDMKDEGMLLIVSFYIFAILIILISAIIRY